jgi:hypothetical protein
MSIPLIRAATPVENLAPTQQNLWITGYDRNQMRKPPAPPNPTSGCGRRVQLTDVEVQLAQSASLPQRPEVQLVQFLVVHIAITRNWPSRLSQESTPVGAATDRTISGEEPWYEVVEVEDVGVQLASQTEFELRVGRLQPTRIRVACQVGNATLSDNTYWCC